MKAQVARVVQDKIGKWHAHVVVTTIGHAPVTLTVEIPDPGPRYAIEFADNGFFRAPGGEWRSPERKVNGKWVNDPDLAGIPLVPVTDQEILRLAGPQLRSHHHQHVVDYCKKFGFDEYVDGDVRVVPTGPVHLSPVTTRDGKQYGGYVEVFVKAFNASTGARLFTDDGVYQFDRPPMIHEGVEDPVVALRVVLANVIRNQNAMT